MELMQKFVTYTIAVSNREECIPLEDVVGLAMGDLGVEKDQWSYRLVDAPCHAPKHNKPSCLSYQIILPRLRPCHRGLSSPASAQKKIANQGIKHCLVLVSWDLKSRRKCLVLVSGSKIMQKKVEKEGALFGIRIWNHAAKIGKEGIKDCPVWYLELESCRKDWKRRNQTLHI
jgi:hypothetical protein